LKEVEREESLDVGKLRWHEKRKEEERVVKMQKMVKMRRAVKMQRMVKKQELRSMRRQHAFLLTLAVHLFATLWVPASQTSFSSENDEKEGDEEDA